MWLIVSRYGSSSPYRYFVLDVQQGVLQVSHSDGSQLKMHKTNIMSRAYHKARRFASEEMGYDADEAQAVPIKRTLTSLAFDSV